MEVSSEEINKSQICTIGLRIKCEVTLELRENKNGRKTMSLGVPTTSWYQKKIVTPGSTTESKSIIFQGGKINH